MEIFAERALLPDGWAENVAVVLEGSRIASVTPGAAPAGLRVGCLVPGMANLHSHAFQRGFSGLTEARGPGRDSFWTWREMMYRFALTLDPEEAEAIAAMAQVEMLEAGYARVGEFHYLHHAPDGTAHADPAEMSARIFAAAEETGIALTHLPVFYAHGGFGPAPAVEGQRRFLHGRDAFLRLVEACDGMRREGDVVGYAPHSLRAASAEDLAVLAEALPDRPVHIHVAEQVKEVDDCLAFCGRRPVEYLMDMAEVGPRWCLIHATHLTAEEVSGIAASGAVAGLCPVTEANLGDGFFPAPDFLAQDGRFGIGTDSNVRISLAEELRVLEYGQRLIHRERNALAAEQGSTGEQLFLRALAGGAQATGADAPQIAPGAAADLAALEDPLGLDVTGPQMLDRWIFGRDLAVGELWAQGRHVVTGGRHRARDAVAARYAKVVNRVLAR
ncbi:formimidoylglutamate deiminase [Mangrovicoccus sp. HB161399]|uniref:formimidoylglutamate deiminase n=1 Tax=Mangrovicoccus sp. HB161399 TaxID=2720392 RepID=UPI0015557B67|nr:formimidoylglutamate deiminase [Mangrovicoccus sp. HB161399]